MKHNILTFILLVLSVVIVGRTAWVTLAEGDGYALESLTYFISNEEIAPPRGLILDKEGRIIADNRKVFDIYLRVGNQNDLDAYIAKLDENFKNLISKRKSSKVYVERGLQDVIVYRSLTNKEVSLLESEIENNKSIRIVSRWERSYSMPYAFSHIIGYTGPVAEEDISSGYGLLDYIGKAKLELQFEENLKGTKGRISDQGKSKILLGEEQGSTINLTIDSEIQNKLYSLFVEYDERNSAAGGAGVFINANSGEILAMVSYPGFDSNLFTSGVSQIEFDSYLKNRDRPLLDKAIASAATPGSTFKIITATELLESSTIDSASTVYSNRCLKVGGSEFCEFGKNFYGTMDVVRAIRKSSNVFFCHYMLDYSNKENINNFSNKAREFGIGQKTGVDLIGEIVGQMDSPEVKLANFNDLWRPGDTCNAAIGQGAIITTPIQMAVAAAITFNPDKKVQPYLVQNIQNIRGQIEYRAENNILSINPVMNSETQAIVRKGMRDVATNSESAVSTFFKDLPNNLHIKTGSAETQEKVGNKYVSRVHGWIIGTFEYNNETYAFSLFQQYGGGSYNLAPLLKDFLQYLNDKQ